MSNAPTSNYPTSLFSPEPASDDDNDGHRSSTSIRQHPRQLQHHPLLEPSLPTPETQEASVASLLMEPRHREQLHQLPHGQFHHHRIHTPPPPPPTSRPSPPAPRHSTSQRQYNPNAPTYPPLGSATEEEMNRLGVPKEIQMAYKDAKARGLPDGWTCSIDKRNRRKWTAPYNGRSCDSIPKALNISVELGLLPPDTVIQAGNPKKKKPKNGNKPTGAFSSKKTPFGAGNRPKKRKHLSPHRVQREDGGKIPDGASDVSSLDRGSTSGDGNKRKRKKKKIMDPSDDNDDEDMRDNKSKKVEGASSDIGDDASMKSDITGSQKGRGKHNETKVVEEEQEESEEEEEEEEELDDEEIVRRPAPEALNPEYGLHWDKHILAPPTTVHWDPYDKDGNKVGWSIRVLPSSDRAGDGKSGSMINTNSWIAGRIVRYDPYTHKHKIELKTSDGDSALPTTPTKRGPGRKPKKKSKDQSTWIWLRNDEHNLQVATRVVWAHVKGYAWWPALVMEAVDHQHCRPGYVNVEFFASLEVATLRDSPECIRPFSPLAIDPVVARHKKKRNAQAFDLASQEYRRIQFYRNEAIIFYARRALEMTHQPRHKSGLVGKRVSLHRTDVNYPYGDTVTAKVRAYSTAQKKVLLSYDLSETTKKKYEASWINVFGKKDCSNFKVLSQKKSGSDNGGDAVELEDLVPYLVGFEYDEDEDGDIDVPHSEEQQKRQDQLTKLLKERCHRCVEYWKQDDYRVKCTECKGEFHIACLDPPMSPETWQRTDPDDFVCSRCIPCRGCYQKDIVFGCHPRPCPPSLSFPKGEVLNLCFTCTAYYDNGQFCPNCAHTWDNDRYERISKRIEYDGALHRLGKASASGCIVEDTILPPILGSFDGEDKLPVGAKVDPSFYRAETTEWGFGENDMLVCDNCDMWVHAGCSGLDEDEYDLTSRGKHPIYSKEFLCRMCCRQRCKELIHALQGEDAKMLFAVPVTEKVAPNYHDVIKNPMDLQTMLEKAEVEEYLNYVWVRESFALMVLNALTFNRFHTAFWNEAKRYYSRCLSNVFGAIGRAAPPGKYDADIKETFRKADEARKMEEDRVQVDESVEKKDLVAGSLAASVTLPPLQKSPPDQSSCLPYTELKLKPTDAFYCSWMDCCFSCGSSGAMDTMVFCVDCGEAYHSFCANAPVHSMDEFAVAGWRCPNCKICEISGDVPKDEDKMLFCEMCDRGFSLELLDPPLDSAPSGLWICGQCVDCRVCGNTSEPEGASLQHWSSDPQKCYRCGGCDDSVNGTGDSLKCKLCTRLLRPGDENVAKCSRCNGSIHSSCHISAKHFLNTEKTRTTMKTDLYVCPSCSPGGHEGAMDADTARKFLSDQAWTAIINEKLPSHENCTNSELFVKLSDEIDWCIRDLWRDEYLALIKEGLRIYSLAKSSYSDPRIIVQHALKGMSGLRMETIQRALRFVLVVRRSNWELAGVSSDRTDTIVHSAKLAASFLKVADAVLGVSINEELKSNTRFEELLVAPDEGGQSILPRDSVRPERDEVIATLGLDFGQLDPKTRAKDLHTTTTEEIKIAEALCGWTDVSGSTEGYCRWKDPRVCCLCHLCGDDDAGFLREDCLASDEIDVSKPSLGRLLPFSDGLFVHTGCAMWSSEVWEDSSDGLLHAVEKARSRGSQLKCFGCGFHGATVGCNKSNCLYNYHFPCAKACGAAFSSSQQVFCKHHRSSASDILVKESYEPMKALMVAPDDKKGASEKDLEAAEGDLCTRVGSLVVHALGNIEMDVDGFHSENYITPPGYVASRIFWSASKPRSRTTYILKIERSPEGNDALFSIIPGDDPTSAITGSSASKAYDLLMKRVRKVNSSSFSNGNLLSKLPAVRKTLRKTYGLNGPQFFGFGLDHVRRLLESRPGIEALAAPITKSSPVYRFCFIQPSIESVKNLIRKRAAVKSEQALENLSGCARTEGMTAIARSGGSGRITRALVRAVRNADDDTGALGGEAAPSSLTKQGEEKAKADRHLTQKKYRRLKVVPMEQRLAARRSHIHGWGLFTKVDIAKDDPIVEYMGETIRQPIADIRERAYEISGEGSCYMFRLDMQRIVDATKIGCMARFMNHSCQPNAYAKIITVDTTSSADTNIVGGKQDKKIVVFAKRTITSGEEITYDYKFPVEDGSLRCTCGAPNCIGRLN